MPDDLKTAFKKFIKPKETKPTKTDTSKPTNK